MVNELFISELQQFLIKPELAPLFSEVIIDTYNQQHQSKESHSDLLKEIDEFNARIRKARELLLSGDIDGSDFKIIKSESETAIEKLEIKLSEALIAKRAYINIEPIAKTAIDRLTRIDDIYCKSSTYDKRTLIGSMYPEKFTFEELQHRTAKTSDLFNYIYLINSKLRGKKEGQATDFSCLPTMAPEAGLEPATL